MNSIMFRNIKLACFRTSISCRYFAKDRAGKCIRPGGAIVLDGAPHRVISIINGKRGKGGGFVRATLKSLVTKNTFEKTFITDEIVETADLEKEFVKFSYQQGDELVFVNESFEEIRISKKGVDNLQFLADDVEIKLMKFGDEIIGIEFPNIAEYTVVSLESKSSSTGQLATLNSGATVFVPQFIKEGGRIRVNIAEKAYVDRA